MLNCLAVDDEPLALALLGDNISKIPFLKLVGKCRNPFEAMEVMSREPIDLIFLDIQMPGLTGIQFLKSLTTAKPMVIFITAYEKFALEGYNLDVLDYLVKPVSFERFLKACNKANELHELKSKKNFDTNKPDKLQVELPDFFFVNADFSHVKIALTDITHVEGMKDYIKIHLSSQTKPIITRMSIKGVEEKLPSKDFMRVHKSFIVSIPKIESLRSGAVIIGKHTIPVSETYREALMRLIE